MDLLPADQFQTALSVLLDGVETLQQSTYEPWRLRASRTLALGLGDAHDLVRKFDEISWQYDRMAWAPGHDYSIEDRPRHARAFSDGQKVATTILETAMFESGLLHPVPQLLASDIDHELWAHLKGEVHRGEWAKVALHAAVYLEDWLRKRAQLPSTTVGIDLAKAAIGTGGALELRGASVGGTQPAPGEAQGWAQLGQGFVLAVRNVVGHRIDGRTDIRTYAMGVVGLVSLLMTEVRAEHP